MLQLPHVARPAIDLQRFHAAFEQTLAAIGLVIPAGSDTVAFERTIDKHVFGEAQAFSLPARRQWRGATALETDHGAIAAVDEKVPAIFVGQTPSVNNGVTLCVEDTARPRRAGTPNSPSTVVVLDNMLLGPVHAIPWYR